MALAPTRPTDHGVAAAVKLLVQAVNVVLVRLGPRLPQARLVLRILELLAENGFALPVHAQLVLGRVRDTEVT